MAKSGCFNMIVILAIVFAGLYFLQTMSPSQVIYREGMKDMKDMKEKEKKKVKENFSGSEIVPASYDVSPDQNLASQINMPGSCGYQPQPDMPPPDNMPSLGAPTCPGPVIGQCGGNDMGMGGQMPQASCFPKSQLNPEELLPKDECNQWSKANPYGAGTLADRNFLEAGWATGISTVGSVLRNANRQLRSEPPNPQQKVSPWRQTTISPDLGRRPLELGGCA